MLFRTVFDRLPTLPYSVPGEDIEILFTLEVDEKGREHLVESGKRSMKDYINSFRDDCDLKSIISKVVRTGDTSLLNVRPGLFIDTTDTPHNLRDFISIGRKIDDICSSQNITFDELLKKLTTPAAAPAPDPAPDPAPAAPAAAAPAAKGGDN